MRRITSPTLLREKFRLVSQILLFGSLGTASSAVVYFLQEQFRQIRRLKCMFDNGKKFTEMARQHGISESTIQRLYENNTENHLLHLESRGQIRFELAPDGPKSMSSPHKGELYHISSTSSSSKKRKRGLGPNNIVSAAIGVSQHTGTCSDGQNSPDRWFRPLSGSSIRPENPTARCQTQDRPFRIQKRPISKAPAFRTGLPISYSTWPSFSPGSRQRPVISKHGRVFGELRRSMTLATLSSVDDGQISAQVPDRLENLCAQILLRHKISLGPFQEQGTAISQSPSVTLQAFLHFMASLELSGRYFKQHLPLLKELIAENRLKLDFVFSSLDANHSYALLLLLYQHLKQRTPWKPALYRLALEAAIKAAKDKKIAQPMILETISDAPKHIDVEAFISVLGRQNLKSIATKVTVLTLQKLIAADFPRASGFLEEFLTQLKYQSPEVDFESVCFEALNNSKFSSDENMALFVSILLREPSPNPDQLSRKLFVIAQHHQSFSSIVKIYQQNPNILERSTAEAIGRAYLELPARLHGSVDFEMLLRALSLEIPRPPLAETLHLVHKYYFASDIKRRRRIAFLESIFNTFDVHTCSDILLSMPHHPEPALHLAYTGLQSSLISRLWDSTRNADEVHNLYTRIRQWYISNSEEVPFEIDSNVLLVSAQTPAFKYASTYAQNVVAHPNAHLNWGTSVQAMKTLGTNDAWGEVEMLLERMHAAGTFPSSSVQLKMLSSVFQARCHRRSGKDVLQFVQTCVAKYGLLLDTKTYDGILSSAIRNQSSQDCLITIQELFKVSARLDEDIGVRRSTIYHALKSFTLANPNASRFLFELFIRVWTFDEQLISRELCEFVMQRLAVDARTMEVSYWRRRPRYQGTADHGRRFKTRLRSEAFHELIRSKLNKRINLLKSAAAHSKWLSESEIVHSPQPRSVSWPPVAYNSKALWRCVTEIERALTLGLPKNAITEFEKFFAQNPPFLGQSLELAVQACLKLDDVPKAKQIQAEASARGYDTSRTEIPLLCYQVRSNNLDATTIQDTVIGWYESGKAKSSGQAHAILVSAVTALLEGESADPMAAINLLLQVHGHPDWSKQYPFHIAVYNVFLAAYARTNHLLGIVWTVQAILEKNLMLTPDFFLCLWQSFGKMRRALQEKGHERRARITNIAYNELVRICRARRLRQEKECFDFGQSLIQTLLYDAPHPGTKAAPRWEGSPGQLEQKQHETRRESKERLRNLRDTWFQDRAASLGLPSARKAVEEMEGDTQDAMRALEQIASRSIPR